MNKPSNFLTQLSYGIIHIEGDQAEKFLQGQLTCDVKEVTATKASLAAVCNPQGRMIASLYLCKFLNKFFFILPIEMVEIVINHLTKYAVFSKVILRNVSQEYITLGLAGNLNAESSEEIPSELYQASYNGTQLMIRISSSQQRFLIFKSMLAEADYPSLDIISQRENDWLGQDILEGVAMVYPQTSQLFTPHMLNYSQLGAISYKKGCYVGQEIIARTHYIGKSKRHLYRGILENSILPDKGAVIYQNNAEVGVIVNASEIEQNKYLVLAVLQDHADTNQLSITELVKIS